MFIKFTTRSNGDIWINPDQVGSVSQNGKWAVIHVAGHNLGVVVKESKDEVLKALGGKKSEAKTTTKTTATTKTSSKTKNKDAAKTV